MKLRRPGVAVLAVLGCLLAVLNLLTVWGRDQILDTDRYLASVLPVAKDPVIQNEVAAEVSTAVSSRLAAADLVAGVLPSSAGSLTSSIGDAVDTFVETKSRELTHSEAFVPLWTELNRAGHVELVRLLRGEQPAAVVVARGRLDVLATVLPIGAISLLLGAAALARRRLTTGAAIAVAVAWSMVLARALITEGAHLAETPVPERVATPRAVHAYYGHVTTLLHRGAVPTGIAFAPLATRLLLAPVKLRLFRDEVADDVATEHRSGRLLTLAVAGFALLVWSSPGTATVVVVLVCTLVLIAFARRLALPGRDLGSGALPAR